LLVICKANSTASSSSKGSFIEGFQGEDPVTQSFAALLLSVPGRNYNYEMGWVGLGWVGLCWVVMCFEEQGKRERLELEEKWG